MAQRQKALVVFQRAVLTWVATLMVGPALGATTEPILWRLENPFRLFVDPAHTALHRATFESLSLDEKRRPILEAERQLAGKSPWGWAENMFAKTCWSQRQQRYDCVDFEDYINPAAHRVVASLGISLSGVCIWTVDPLDAASRSNVQKISAPCDQAAVIEIPYPAGARVSVAHAGQPLTSTEIRVRDVFVVGIGDSYASGDGNPDVAVRFDDRRSLNYRGPADTPSGYPARVGTWTAITDPEFDDNAPDWLAPGCHRSLYGHQVRAALQLAIEDPHRAVTFAGFSCWGSDTVNGIFLRSKPTELVPNLPRVPQLSAVAQAQCGRRNPTIRDWPRAFDQGGLIPELSDLSGLFCPPAVARPIDLLLVTIGGNDIGFAQLVANAILRDATPLRTISGLLGQVSTVKEARAAITRLEPRFKALNRAAHNILHVPWSQSDRIVLTAYPPIALHDTTRDACPSGRQGMSVMPGFALDQQRTRDSENIGLELHATMQRLTKVHGWSFIDTHRTTFARHGLCAGSIGSLSNPADDVRLPLLMAGDWHPYPPSQWEPYASRRRWIRTPNDGYLTVNFHVSKIADAAVNLLLASSYSGSFHPTAEGQAAMADAVVDRARAILEKYRVPKSR